MKKWRKLGVMLISSFILAATALTGCGGGSKESSGQSQPSGQTQQQPSKDSSSAGKEEMKEKKYSQGVTDTSIKFGTWGPMTGPAATYSIVSKGTDVYFKYLNEKEGGVNGRKLELVVINDEYQPAKAVAAAKKLVEEDKVFALVGTLGTPSNAAAMPYLTKAGIPVIAPSTGSSLWAKPVKPNYFALQTNYEVEGKLFVHYAKDQLKAETVGIFYQNDDFGKEGHGAAKDLIEKLGLKLVAEAPYNPSDVDFAPAALKMKEANPDVIMMFAIPKPAAAFVRELDKIGVTAPKKMVSYVCADRVMFDLAGKGWEGVITTSWLPILKEDDPQFKDFIEGMKKHYPQENSTSSLALAGWAYGEVAVEALRRAGDDLTWENYIKSLETLKDWNDGFTYNVTYTADQRQGQNAAFFIQAKNGDYEKISDYMESKD